MHIVQATYRDGVFAPDGTVPFTEGAKVTLQVQISVLANHPEEQAAAISMDPWTDSDEDGAPFDLPMPSDGRSVLCDAEPVPLPDPPIFREPSTVE